MSSRRNSQDDGGWHGGGRRGSGSRSFGFSRSNGRSGSGSDSLSWRKNDSRDSKGGDRRVETGEEVNSPSKRGVRHDTTGTPRKLLMDGRETLATKQLEGERVVKEKEGSGAGAVSGEMELDPARSSEQT